jgi:hypothetical protein
MIFHTYQEGSMKRLLPLFCILVVLVVSAAGVASAESPLPDSFTIVGYTTSYTPFPPEPTNGPRIKFELLAEGTVIGAAFNGGEFRFEEQGNVDYASGAGTNHGDLTISMPDGGKAVIRFDGKVDQATASVEGNWRVLSSSGGNLQGLQAQGTYFGVGGLVFAVTFTGSFH